jgi:hypothetical protein
MRLLTAYSGDIGHRLLRFPATDSQPIRPPSIQPVVLARKLRTSPAYPHFQESATGENFRKKETHKKYPDFARPQFVYVITLE